MLGAEVCDGYGQADGGHGISAFVYDVPHISQNLHAPIYLGLVLMGDIGVLVHFLAFLNRG
jgi:hypothetical protein